MLELDELWTYVGSKQNPVWLWIALCRRTRQVVAWHHGSRSLLCCRQLWNKIPQPYKSGLVTRAALSQERPCHKSGLVFTDFWQAYQDVVPDKQHRPCAKQDGQTNHVERFNLTLRQRIGRLTRRTLSFSKSHLMHQIHIRLFFLHHNQQQARRFNASHPT